MLNTDFNDYLNGLYAVIDTPLDEKDDDGIVYVDEEFEDDGDSWGDDITYIGEEETEDDYLELGDDYIPLPQGDDVQYEAIVIDENYVLDEYETDIDGATVVYVEDDEFEQTKSMLLSDDEALKDELYLNPDDAESVIKLPESKTMAEELNYQDLDPIDDKISKAIARDYMVDAEASVDLLPGDTLEEDTSWVDSEDMFGNNIELILADDPNMEIEDTDYVEGSFEDWIRDNGVTM